MPNPGTLSRSLRCSSDLLNVWIRGAPSYSCGYDFTQLQDLPRLWGVHVQDVELQAAEFADLIALPTRELDLSRGYALVDDELALWPTPKLRSLNLRAGGLGAETLAELVTRAENLESLTCGTPKFSRELTNAVANRPSLTYLDLTGVLEIERGGHASDHVQHVSLVNATGPVLRGLRRIFPNAEISSIDAEVF